MTKNFTAHRRDAFKIINKTVDEFKKQKFVKLLT